MYSIEAEWLVTKTIVIVVFVLIEAEWLVTLGFMSFGDMHVQIIIHNLFASIFDRVASFCVIHVELFCIIK
jgi:hypothetical protein